jgi:hypothetical protein
VGFKSFILSYLKAAEKNFLKKYASGPIAFLIIFKSFYQEKLRFLRLFCG